MSHTQDLPNDRNTKKNIRDEEVTCMTVIARKRTTNVYRARTRQEKEKNRDRFSLTRNRCYTAFRHPYPSQQIRGRQPRLHSRSNAVAGPPRTDAALWRDERVQVPGVVLSSLHGIAIPLERFGDDRVNAGITIGRTAFELEGNFL